MKAKPSYMQDTTQGDVQGIKELNKAEGFYFGSRTVSVKGRDSMIHMIAPYQDTPKECKLISIWGSTMLDQSFAALKPGCGVIVSFLKEEKNDKGTLILADVRHDPNYLVDVSNYPNLGWSL